MEWRCESAPPRSTGSSATPPEGQAIRLTSGAPSRRRGQAGLFQVVGHGNAERLVAMRLEPCF
jgi:hypothetical protein